MTLYRFLFENRFMVTKMAILWAILVFIGEGLLHRQDRFIDFGNCTQDQLWQGEFWRLLTSCFLHGGILHILFNCLILFRFGIIAESLLGTRVYAAFFIAAGFISSTAHALVSIHPGRGLSGILYAVFGFVWWLRRYRGDLATEISDEETKSLWGWLFLCFPLTWLGILPVANAAHVGGAVYGIVMGMAFRLRKQRWKQIAVIVAAHALIVASVAYAVFPLHNRHWRLWREQAAAADPAQQLATLEHHLARYPEDDKVRFEAAILAWKLKEIKNALEHLQRIPPSSSYYSTALYYRGILLAAYGRKAEAQACLDELKSLPAGKVDVEWLNELRDAIAPPEATEPPAHDLPATPGE